MTDILDDIQTPFMRFGSPHCSALRYECGDVLRHAPLSTIAAWSKMEEYYVIDSEGRMISLSDPKPVDPPTGLGAIWANIVGKKLAVKWRFTDHGMVSVDNFKDRLTNNFEQYPEVWEAYALTAIRDQLKIASHCRDVLAIFGQI